MLTSIEQIQIKILFVCLGNICRSPAAHGIMLHLLTTEYKNLKNTIFVDSCGTIDYNSGDLPDRRMREEALNRGIILDHIARGINLNDINYQTLLIIFKWIYNNFQDIINNLTDDTYKDILSILFRYKAKSLINIFISNIKLKF